MASPTVPPHRLSPSYGPGLAEAILARCSEADYAPGGRLPTERRLASELGVTRTMVRHALAVLEAEGRISREVGRGTFLRAPAGDGGGPPSRQTAVDEVGPADVMAARRVIEPQVLPLVVAWATQRDFDELRRCVLGGATAQSAAEFETWDFALHHAIVAASRNQLLRTMYRVIEQAREGELWGTLKRRNDSRERRALYQADHVELVEAICARELHRAVEVMDAHLERVQANLLGSLAASSATVETGTGVAGGGTGVAGGGTGVAGGGTGVAGRLASAVSEGPCGRPSFRQSARAGAWGRRSSRRRPGGGFGGRANRLGRAVKQRCQSAHHDLRMVILYPPIDLMSHEAF